MKSDRELLEAAAKAAGLVIDKSPYNGGDSGNDGFDVMGNAMLDWHNYKKWNPLTDDGDALRLAVKLRLQVEVWEQGCSVARINLDDPFGNELVDELGADLYAATRRAIVRAAAELGK